jgi:pyruvate-ferredoxin/flavodoxin oxidoreductase
VTVLERTDQPLAVDAPLLRELRAALGTVENGAEERARAHGGSKRPLPTAADLPAIGATRCRTSTRRLRLRQPRPAAGRHRGRRREHAARWRTSAAVLPRHRLRAPGTRLPKLQIWQEKLLGAYPHIEQLALAPAGDART